MGVKIKATGEVDTELMSLSLTLCRRIVIVIITFRSLTNIPTMAALHGRLTSFIWYETTYNNIDK